MIIFEPIKTVLAKSGIYCIFNKVNAKSYIGSAININKRIRTHSQQLIDNEHHSILLQRAYNKYGHNAFEIFVLEFVENPLNLLYREQFWLDLNKSANPKFGYNLTPTAGSLLGYKYSEEGLANVKAAMTDERKAHLSACITGTVLGPRPEDVKAKIKATLTGVKHPPERTAKLKNLKRSDEFKSNVSKAMIKMYADRKLNLGKN